MQMLRMMKITHPQQGFTLVELMVAVAIAAILASLAVPSFKDSVKRARLDGARTSFLSELAFARSEAVKRSQPVTICASTDEASCDTNDWSAGRLVFIDHGNGSIANEANGSADAGEPSVKTFPVRPDVAMTSTNFPNAGTLTFLADGSITNTGTFVICENTAAPEDSDARAINVNVVGRPQAAYDTDAPEDNIVNDLTGGNVSC